MAQRVTHDSRSAIKRARLFLGKAKECSSDERVDFEAYIEASIVFSRAAIHRVKTQYEKEKEFKKWWDSIRTNPSIEFFRYERNFILKEGPPKIGQIIRAPTIPSLLREGGQRVNDIETEPTDEKTTDESLSAANLYYYEDPSEPATYTVEKHLDIIEKYINELILSINNPS